MSGSVVIITGFYSDGSTYGFVKVSRGGRRRGLTPRQAKKRMRMFGATSFRRVVVQ